MLSFTQNRAFASSLPKVFILSAARTPVGSFRSSLASVPATELGSIVIRGALVQAGLHANAIEECLMGNVVSANLGQAPARQAALGAGLDESTICTTVNKVCASGLKAVMLGAQSIQLGHKNVVIAGGMESMSNVPFYLDKMRGGHSYGHGQFIDGILKDGLWDPKYQVHMGNCAEETAAKYSISREMQDEHAITSYKRAAEAVQKGLFKNEIIPIVIKTKKGDITVVEDEEYKKIDFSKVPTLKSAFIKDGTVTAANSSTLNDGASALILSSEGSAQKLGIRPLAEIIAYADAECNPKLFTVAPSLAIPKALKAANLSINDISLFEINEAFSVVIRANEKILGLDAAKVNIAGGAVSLGHPIGSSGSRILVTLVNLLKSGELGCAAICNGGGGASTLIVKKL